MFFMDVVAYFVALAALTFSPGPLSAILVAKTLAGDKRGALTFGSGIAIGDSLIILVVCSGLGMWLQSTPQIFTVGKALSVAYILWIAMWMLQRDKLRPASSATQKKFLGELGSGVIACVSSPQTLLLYLVLVPRLIDLNNITLSPFLILLATTAAALFVSVFVMVSLADSIRSRVTPRSDRSITDWMLAAVVAGSGLYIVSM